MTNGGNDSETSASLIPRVGRTPTDESAWAEFVDRYGPKVLAWGRSWGLQQADAEDVTQAVLVKLSRQMGRFSYDASSSFRGWLRTLTRNAWHDWAARRNAVAAAEGGVQAEGSLASVEARDDLVTRLEEMFDLEVLAEAIHRVRGRVAEKTWDAYRLMAMDEQPVLEVASRLGMTVAGAYKAKNNVLKRIREAVRALNEGPTQEVAS